MSFEQPAAHDRPAPFWSWNDQLDGAEMERQIEEFHKQGMGGFFMHSRVGLVTGYLSPKWMELTRLAAQKAKDLNMSAWLYDEDRWPSGYGGGAVAQNEEYRAKALVALPPEQVQAYDTELERFTHGGAEYVICRRVAPMGHARFNSANYADLMNPKAVRAFLDCTHEAYKEACGEYFGNAIPGVFTDEPCYLYTADYPNTPVVPWSDCIPACFQARAGYSLDGRLKELFLDIGNYRKTRFDFYDAASRLLLESFTTQYAAWCEENGLLMTGHFMAEDTLLGQIKWIGAAMPHYEKMHWPGIDKLHKHVQQVVTVKQLTSVADQLDKPRAISEVFGCIGQQASFRERKWISDWQAALGINFVNPHLALYSMRGERKRDFPANLFYQQPWWEQEHLYSDYIGRVNAFISQGKRLADILVIHPIASMWCDYSPLHPGNRTESGAYDVPLDLLSKALMAENLDFHYGDETILEGHGHVEKGRLTVGSHSYSAVVIPPCCTLRRNTVRLLGEFAEGASGRILALEPSPTLVDGSPSALNFPFARFSSQEALLARLHSLDASPAVTTDLATGGNAEALFCHRRKADGEELCLFANTDAQREIRTELTLPSPCGTAVVLDPMSGKRYALKGDWSDGRLTLRLNFQPAGSLLLSLPASPAPGLPAMLALDCGVSVQEEAYSFEAPPALRAIPEAPNALALNDAALTINGGDPLPMQPLSRLWHTHFYPAPEGAPFRAEYQFEVLGEPSSQVTAVIEMAENLERITCNGKEVHALKAPGQLGAFDPVTCWQDVHWTRVPLGDALCPGVNRLVLEGRKSNNIVKPNWHSPVNHFESHRPTELEAVYLLGDFAVRDFQRQRFALDFSAHTPCSTDLTASGYPFYTGPVRFETSFIWDGEAPAQHLCLDGVHASFVELELNGVPLGCKLWGPYQWAVSGQIKKGGNKAVFHAASTLFNLLGPNRVEGIENITFVSPNTFADQKKFTPRYTLLPFGLGKATLL